MKSHKIHNSILVLFVSACIASAQVVPTPEIIYNSATNFWYGNNLAGFTTYTTNLYSGAVTNHVAPTLLSAFHDYVFLGELVSASNKYARVQNKVSTSPGQFSDFFKSMMSMIMDSISGDIKRYNDANKPLSDAKTLAAPQEIRDESAESDFLFPHLLIIKNSPEIQF